VQRKNYFIFEFYLIAIISCTVFVKDINLNVIIINYLLKHLFYDLTNILLLN